MSRSVSDEADKPGEMTPAPGADVPKGPDTDMLVVHAASATDEALSKTLAQVRPWSLMVVIASDEAYVEEILRSFR